MLPKLTEKVKNSVFLHCCFGVNVPRFLTSDNEGIKRGQTEFKTTEWHGIFIPQIPTAHCTLLNLLEIFQRFCNMKSCFQTFSDGFPPWKRTNIPWKLMVKEDEMSFLKMVPFQGICEFSGGISLCKIMPACFQMYAEGRNLIDCTCGHGWSCNSTPKMKGSNEVSVMKNVFPMPNCLVRSFWLVKNLHLLLTIDILTLGGTSNFQKTYWSIFGRQPAYWFNIPSNHRRSYRTDILPKNKMSPQKKPFQKKFHRPTSIFREIC